MDVTTVEHVGDVVRMCVSWMHVVRMVSATYHLDSSRVATNNWYLGFFHWIMMVGSWY